MLSFIISIKLKPRVPWRLDALKTESDGDDEKLEDGEKASDEAGAPPGSLILDGEGIDAFAASNLAFKEVLPIVAAVTPASLRTGSLALTVPDGGTDSLGLMEEATPIMTLTFDDPDTQCGPTNGARDTFPECQAESGTQEACTFVVEIRCRLYHKGPTEIAYWLEKVDEQTADFERRSKDKYVPCADPENENFKSVKVDAKFPNLLNRDGEPQPLDLGFSYHLNCLSSDENYSQGFGHKKDEEGNVTTYLYNAQHADTSAMGSVAIVDHLDNVDFWTTLPGPKNATKYSDLEYSAGLIHIKTVKETNGYEMSVTGTGVGNGCGVVVKSDGTYLYARANANSFYSCFEGANLDSGELTPPEFSTDKVDVEYCLKVNDGEKISQVGLETCTNAGLTFESISISYLKQETIEAFNTSKVFSTAPEGIPDFKTLSQENFANENGGHGDHGGDMDHGSDDDKEGEGDHGIPSPSIENVTESGPGQFTCNQNFAQDYNKNCSTLFEANSINDAAGMCVKSEAEGGHGCCTSASVWTNNYGNVVSFEVVPAGLQKGEGNTWTCPTSE